MHIRRGDHLTAIAESPVQLFVEIMGKDLSDDKEINYYLSTDDSDVELFFKKKFPGRIIYYPKEFSRQSKRGIIDAMVDLYSLANTSKIYGSFESSFSDIASRIKGIPLVIVRKNN